MNGLIIYGDGRFSALSAAFGGEIDGDCDLSAEIVCVDEEEIRRLNRELRGVDAVTDVLSFPALDGIFGRRIEKKNLPFDCDEQGNLFIGSIAICLKRAEEQAEEYGHGADREICYLAVHGILHLLGYYHMTDKDKASMRAAEEKILSKLGLER